MSTFTLHLQGATRYERIEQVESFVGEDASGTFGLLAGHARFMTVLVFGLARFRTADAGWQYLALPGGVCTFDGRDLVLSARRFVRDADYATISEVLDRQLVAEEAGLRVVRESMKRLQEEMFKRLWRLERPGVA